MSESRSDDSVSEERPLVIVVAMRPTGFIGATECEARAMVSCDDCVRFDVDPINKSIIIGLIKVFKAVGDAIRHNSEISDTSVSEVAVASSGAVSLIRVVDYGNGGT